MPSELHNRSRLMFTLATALFAALHVGWELFHGGIRSHHLLNQAALPAISNAWGLLVLPVLTWFLIGRMQTRSKTPAHLGLAWPVILGLVGAVLYGVLLSVGFTLGYEAVTSTMFLGLFAIALVLPLYRSEYLLGFVLGMTFCFGAVLPMLVAGVFVLASALFHPLVRYVIRTVRRPLASM